MIYDFLKIVKQRVILVGIIFIVFFAVIAFRVVYLQVYQHSWLFSKAQDQYKRSVVLKGKRGTIFDNNSKIMAVSVDTFSLGAHPEEIKNLQVTIKSLNALLPIKKKSLLSKLSKKKPFVWIKHQVTPKEAMAIKRLNLDGIVLKKKQSRFYPHRNLAAQVIGLTGTDDQGLEGVEYFYNAHLSGRKNKSTIFKDRLGREFDSKDNTLLNATGNNIILTIDGTIQYSAEKIIKDTVMSFGGKSGMIVVMDPKTGALLAIAHYPFYNPNKFNEYSRDYWRNRATYDFR